jgi:hypothetical protein
VKALEYSSRFFCSELSRGVAEKTFGTASLGAVWLLLEYPHGWGRHAFEESALSSEVKSHFKQSCAAIKNSRLLFIKTDRGRRDARMSLFVVRCRERKPFVVRFQLEKYDDARAIDFGAVATNTNLQGGVVTNRPLYLVCTHGRRDKCCAKFGIPLFNSLSEVAGDAVWQASHVGGDRFAANLLCFPHGLFYAHMTGESGRRVAGEYGAGRMALDKFRGRACYAPHVQAAEYFVRAESGVAGVEDLRFLSSELTGETIWRVRFTAATGGRVYEARVRSRVSEFRNFITCNSQNEKTVPQFSLEEYRTAEVD